MTLPEKILKSDNFKISLELTVNEAIMICNAIASHHPPLENEDMAIIVYALIRRKIDEVTGANSPL